MSQSRFAFGATVEASINIPRLHLRALLRAAKWPAIVAIPGMALYGGAIYLMAESISGQASSALAGRPGLFAMLLPLISLVPLGLAVVAFSYNWQRFVMNGDESSQFSNQNEASRVPPEWWQGYRQQLVKWIQLIALYMVPNILFLGPMIGFTSESFEPSKQADLISVAGFFAFFITIILLAPYFIRASLVFPAIAAGLPDATFKNALAVSKGMGWRMLGAYFVSLFALMVIMMLGMIALMIAGAIFGGIASLIGAASAVAIVTIPLGLVFYVGLYLYMAAFYAGFPAIVLMQILPDFHDRWDQLSGGTPSDSTPPQSDEFKLSSYGKRKDEA